MFPSPLDSPAVISKFRPSGWRTFRKGTKHFTITDQCFSFTSMMSTITYLIKILLYFIESNRKMQTQTLLFPLIYNLLHNHIWDSDVWGGAAPGGTGPVMRAQVWRGALWRGLVRSLTPSVLFLWSGGLVVTGWDAVDVSDVCTLSWRLSVGVIGLMAYWWKLGQA